MRQWPQQIRAQAAWVPLPRGASCLPGVLLPQRLHGGEELDAVPQGHGRLLLLLRLQHAHVFLVGLWGAKC